MKLLLKILVLFGAVLLLAAAVLTFAFQPQAFLAGGNSALRLQPGPWTVATFGEVFVDEARRTPSNGDYAGAAHRRMEGDVWYPGESDAGAAPLLVFSHGFTSLRGNGTYLAEHLASHGFVVVAVDYPLTHMGAPGGPAVEDVVNQPADVSFLIDSLLAHAADPGHALYRRIDAQRIGVLGISLGGLTSTLVGFHPDWRDPRIGAVLSIAGPSNFFTPRFFQHADIPFLMLAGDLDVLVPYASNAVPIPGKVPGAELVTIHGGSHTGFSGGTALLRFMKNTDALGCYSVLRSIDGQGPGDWKGLLGTPEQGIDYGVENELCLVDPLPATTNVLRQQMISRVVVTAFFEKTLIADIGRQTAAARYLEELMAGELPDVDYERSPALN